MTRFDQFPLPLHIPIPPRPTCHGHSLHGWRTVQGLRCDLPPRPPHLPCPPPSRLGAVSETALRPPPRPAERARPGPPRPSRAAGNHAHACAVAPLFAMCEQEVGEDDLVTLAWTARNEIHYRVLAD